MPAATEALIKRAIRAAKSEGCGAVIVCGAEVRILVSGDTKLLTSTEDTGFDEWDAATKEAAR